MSEKPKVAFYWCAACGGCDEAVVDLAEGILDVVAAVDIVLWPVAMDFKKADIEARPDKSILVSFINGSIRSSEQVEWVRLLRKKSQLVISFGTCAGGGGIPALANEFSREEILKYVYETCPSNVNESKVRPGPTPVAHNGDGSALTLPELHEQVRSLDQVVAVDYYLPGCPPTPKIIAAAVGALLSGKMPPPGTVLSPDKALCDECRRKDSKPADLSLAEFKRPHQMHIDPEKCLLAQGLLCMGGSTRSGCEALCPEGNMPCTGCFGPTSRVRDKGAKVVSAILSNIAADEPEAIDKILDTFPDPVGTLYRYGFSKAMLRRKQDD